jgi:hypothetical protein
MISIGGSVKPTASVNACPENIDLVFKIGKKDFQWVLNISRKFLCVN